MESRLLSIVSFAVIIAAAWAYPTSVPATPAVCSKMTPGHGPSPQKYQAPYKISVSKNSVQGGNSVEVTLAGIGEAEFIGYYVQARDKNSSPIGEFVKADGVKTHGCGGIKNNGAHHSSKEEKQSVVVFWKAPKDFTGDVTFTATFVEEFEKFWTMVKSSPVSVSKILKDGQQIRALHHHSFIIDSREEKGETYKPSQEGRILNYNPYSPKPSRNKHFVSDAFQQSNTSTEVPTGISSSPSATRIRKSYYIPQQTFQQEGVSIPIPDNDQDCTLSPHYHIHHHSSADDGSINNPTRQQRQPPYYHQSETFKEMQPTRFQSLGAGYLNLDGLKPSPLPPISHQTKYANHPPNYGVNPLPGFRPNFFGSQNPEYHNYNPIKSKPTFLSHPYLGTKSNTKDSWQKPIIPVPVTNNYPGNVGQHGILVGDYISNPGIVIPKGMQSYQIPRYGYLVFNPSRGPPYYFIPVADSASFEEAHNLIGDNFPVLPQPALGQFRSRTGGISFEPSRNSAYRKA